MKIKDDIEFKQFSNEVDYCYRKFSEENDKRMKDLNNQRKLDNKNKRQSSLWANAIKMVNFNVYLCRRFYTKSSQIGGKNRASECPQLFWFNIINITFVRK